MFPRLGLRSRILALTMPIVILVSAATAGIIYLSLGQVLEASARDIAAVRGRRAAHRPHGCTASRSCGGPEADVGEPGLAGRRRHRRGRDDDRRRGDARRWSTRVVAPGQVRVTTVELAAGAGPSGASRWPPPTPAGLDGRRYTVLVAVATQVETTALGRSTEFALIGAVGLVGAARRRDDLRHRPGPAPGRADARPGREHRRVAAGARPRGPTGPRRAVQAGRDAQPGARTAAARRRLASGLRRRCRARAAQPARDHPRAARPARRGPPARGAPAGGRAGPRRRWTGSRCSSTTCSSLASADERALPIADGRGRPRRRRARRGGACCATRGMPVVGARRARAGDGGRPAAGSGGAQPARERRAAPGRRRCGCGSGTTAAEALLDVDNDGPPVRGGGPHRIFGRFVRLDDSRTRDTGGTGLGPGDRVRDRHRARRHRGGRGEPRRLVPLRGQAPSGTIGLSR